MKTSRSILGYVFSILVVLLACSKDSNSDKEYEDPRYYGYFEAKVNGELRSWGNAMASIPAYYNCFVGVNSVYLYTSPEIPEMIYLRFDVHEDWGCEGVNASYSIFEGDENIVHYDSRDLCEDDDPFTPTTYICHDVSFTMNNVGNDIYRGTFSFTASRNCGEDLVVVTEGKFDFKTEAPPCD